MIKKGLLYLKSNAQLRNFGVYGIGQFFNLVTPLIVAPYVISVCGISGYGKASLAMALMFFLMVFIDYGADLTGVKNISVARNDRKVLERVFTVAIASRALMFALVSGVAAAIFISVPYFKSESELFLLSLTVLAGQMLNPTWFLQGVENFSQITFANVVSKFIYLSGVFVFITQPRDYIWLNVLWAAGMILAYALSLWAIVKQYSFSFRQVRLTDIRHYLSDGFSIFYSQVFLSVQMYAPIVIVGMVGGDVMAGQYRVIDQVIVVFKTYILLFFNFVFSRVCYLLEHNPKHGLRYWFTANGGNLVFLALSMAVIGVFARDVVAYFDPSHRDELAPVLLLAVWLPLLMGISVPLKQLVVGAGREARYSQITMMASVVSLALVFWWVSKFGVSGSFLALITIEALTILLFLAFIKDKLLEWSK